MTTSLCTLAVELIEAIATNLGLRDLCSLRLVCCRVNKSVSPDFGKRFLHTIQTDLSAQNLRDLEKLSDIGKHVRSMVIKQFNLCPERKLGYENTWHRHRMGYLLFPILPVEQLRDVLVSSFYNCKSFQIHQLYDEYRPPNSEWINPSDAFAIILTVILEAKLPVESFTLDFYTTYGATVDATRVPPALHQELDLRILWSNLQVLPLTLTLTKKNHEWIRKFIQSASQLRKLLLTIRAQNAGPNSYLRHFFDNSIASWEDMPPLQEVRLQGCWVSAKGLTQFATKIGNSLRVLSLTALYMNNVAGDWKLALQEMGQHLTLLESFSLSMLWDDSRKRLHFPALLQDNIIPPRAGWIAARTGLDIFCNMVTGSPAVFGVRFQRPNSDMTLETLGKLASLRT
jgi:hypothetical protein